MILEILDGLGNLAGAEFLPLRAFLAFFCKISTPVEYYKTYLTNVLNLEAKDDGPNQTQCQTGVSVNYVMGAQIL